MKLKIFLTILFIALATVGGFYYYKNINTSNNSNINNTNPVTNQIYTPANNDTQALNESNLILYIATESGNQTIYALDDTNLTKQLIYSDKDSDIKLKSARSITNTNQNILATFSLPETDSSQSLYFIDANSTDYKTELSSNFNSATTPVVNSDATKIAYATFSNTRFDYGFKLVVSDLGNLQAKDELTNDTNSIANIAFSLNGNTLYYTKGSPVAGAGLYSYNLITRQESQLYDLKKTEAIYSLASLGNDKIAFSKGPVGQNELNKSEIFILNSDGTNLTQLTNNNLHENFLISNTDATKIAYLAINYDDNTTYINKTGDIHELLIGAKQDNDLQVEAQSLIGYKDSK